MNTGIPRVVRNVLRHLLDLGGEEAIAVVPVIFRRKSFVAVSPESVLNPKLRRSTLRGPDPMSSRWRLGRWISTSCRTVAEWSRFRNRCSIAGFFRAEPNEQHVLLLLDASWAYDIWPSIEDLKKCGLRVVSVIYDLIPLTHSHTVVEPLVTAFRRWLFGQVEFADGIVCISKGVAAAVEKHVAEQLPAAARRRTIRMANFYLGAELDLAEGASAVQEKLLALKSETSPIFLMVGTIEPRKNHRLVFNAFQRLWTEGVNARLAIVGAREWKAEDLLSEMAGHPEAGRQLLLIRDATDSDLKWLYENASALIMASDVEGFGLPIVEARQTGLPVICSDIPIFRELAARGTEFFRRGDVDDLLTVIRSHLASPRARDRTVTGWITWRESSRQLLNAVRLTACGS